MFKRIVIPALATLLAFAFFLASPLAALLLFIGYGLPPCQDATWFYSATRILLPIAFLSCAIWMGWLKWKPDVIQFFAALALPLGAVGLYTVAQSVEAAHQQRCSKRTLSEAIAVCGVHPSHYRLGKSQFGNTTVTLIAPGITDNSWQCLSRWTYHNDGSVSLKVDESVYDHYRLTQSTQ